MVELTKSVRANLLPDLLNLNQVTLALFKSQNPILKDTFTTNEGYTHKFQIFFEKYVQ